ncbi:EcsC family protein [Cognatishimia sp. WU-CL00825]|uniref:EcsC family protein n=1 Tax=Cognatishimia sp. WU-CL00825 TaxID=3127658 RepID=UPI003103FD53
MRDNEIITVDIELELQALVQRYQRAGGVGIDVLNLLGAQADGLVERLPSAVKDSLEAATEAALRQAMRAAHGSRRVVGEQKGWLHTALATALGAAGGAGGVPTALAELPITTTILLRSIQDVAVEYGFDPESDNVQFDCVQVFGAAGPLASDDGADLAFLGARIALTSGGVQRMAAMVAPRLAAVMGQKLAAQAVPVIGAAAGAATNYAYTTYYREIAHVHFGLRKLAIDGDVSHTDLIQSFREKLVPEIEAD